MANEKLKEEKIIYCEICGCGHYGQVCSNCTNHKFKMEELEYQRESNRLFHEREMERGRIKSAEIRKMQMRKFGQDPYRS
jgi:hypothetical protein